MNTTLFLELLAFFSVLTGVITEVIKNIMTDKEHISYNLISMGVAIVVGLVGTLLYYQLYYIPFTLNNIIYAILLGGASGLTAQIGYDKFCQLLSQLPMSKED